jgi:cell shape-determining protein MreC
MSTKPRTRLLFGAVLVVAPFALPLSAPLTAASLLASIQRPLALGGRHLAFSLQALANLRSLARENEKLHNENAELRAQLAHIEARGRARDRKFRQLSEFNRVRRNLITTDAEVIGEGAGAERGILFIDRGSADRIVPGMVAVAGKAVVGTVRGVSTSLSTIRLAIAPGSRIDCEIVSTAEPGIVYGNGDGSMRMEYVAREAPRAGDQVVTRGRDARGLQPRHFLVGTVTEARRRPGHLAYDVTIEPPLKLRTVESVVVVRRTRIDEEVQSRE